MCIVVISYTLQELITELTALFVQSNLVENLANYFA